MRIHRLEIQAFGPFAGREIVDFDALGAQGLFLLNGSTGAGKTTVLDAIAYALYGQVPGARQGATAQFRSHHAAEGVGPEVICEFTAGGRRLEVRRSPEWMRPVKRGTGMTREQASTQLREHSVDGGWEVKSTRNDEAASEIQELLGMNMAQFTKVVLLAQGDFAAFLRATPEDRQTLLQKLFGTDIFKDLEVRLATDAKTAQAQVASGLAQLAATEQLARSQSARALADADAVAAADTDAVAAQDTDAVAAADSDSAAESFVEVADLVGHELFLELERRLTLAVGQALTKSQAAQELSDAAGRTVQEAQARSNRHQALEQAETEQTRLADLAPEVAQWRHDMSQHRAAQLLGPVVTAFNRAQGAHESAQSAADRAAGAVDGNELASALLGKSAATATEPELSQVSKELTTQMAAVAAALPDEERQQAKAEQLERNIRALAQAEENKQHQSVAASDASARLEQLRQEQERLRVSADNVDHAAQKLQQARELVTAIEQFTRQKSAVEQLDEADKNARATALDAKEHWLEAFNLRLSQAAGELAAELVDGQPCQVCGSTVHPAPSPLAGTGADLVKEEKRSKTTFEAAESQAAIARAALSEAQSALAVLAERGGQGELEKAQAAVDHAEAERTRAVAEAAMLAALAAEATELQAQISAAQAEVLTATAQAASLSAGNTALEQELADLEQRLTDARNGYAQLSERMAALRQAQAPCEALVRALQQLGSASEASQQAGAALDMALAGSVFAAAEEVDGALLTATAAAAVEQRLADHDRQTAINDDRLAGGDVQEARRELEGGATAPTPAELTRLQEVRQQARALATSAALALGLAESAAQDVAATQKTFDQLEAAVAPQREQAQLLSGLAEAVRGGGDNKMKMTLTSYVLAARLEQVAQAASVRLATMSDARYTLRHSDARAGSGRKSGLGLEVIDEWTGLSRNTGTLSGGESFMASLALALGLSDVVQYESGGLDIETLFVDEGFGSLDEESLEQVMDALEGLRDGGRMVGLVSHVAEMKQRIPLHLQVHKGRHGSTLELTMAGSAAP